MSDASETICDLLVIGSGAGGLATAVTAAWLGLDVIVIEKHHQLGGTTAWSGGWMWLPRNPLAAAAGIIEDIETPRRYLRAELGDRFDAALIDMFLEQAPAMTTFFKSNTSVDFVDGNAIPDFHSENEGGARGGRSLCAAPFDGRLLGARINDLRPPLDLIAPFGMGIASGADLRHFINASTISQSFWHVAKRLARHALDRLRFGRGMHLVAGNALVARLLKSADDLGVRVMPSTPALGVITDNGAVVGATVGSSTGPKTIRARRGVVLAAGGFPHDSTRISELFPHAPTGQEHWSAAPETNTGDGLRLGETAGGAVDTTLTDAGAWTPVSLVPRPDGAFGRFPHLVERAKPGLIAVLANGRRFANEADSYHDMMGALLRAAPVGTRPEAWLICDHRFQRRYGLGRARPWPFPLKPHIRSGYLKRAPTIEALANACGISPAALAQTITAFNAAARDGRDPEFHRGGTAYNRIQGEPTQAPNPCVAPIEHGPFFAVKIVAGSLGTFSGLKTNAHACVLGASGQPIAGLYAVGNDMSSIMGGHYPAGGITLGPAMTFGYVAAHHASGIPLANNRSAPRPTAPIVMPIR